MKIQGEYKLKHDRQTVWDMLNSREVLEASIPGAESLIETGPDSYDVSLNVGVGIVRGSFGGTVKVVDKDEPNSYRMLVEGQGPGGWLKGDGKLSLIEHAHGQTTVAVDGDAQVGGILARVGQRMIGNASKSIMSQFFKNLEKEANKAAGK